MNGGYHYPHRVVVTGMGLITPIGIGRDAFWQGIRGERVATARIERFDPSQFDSQLDAEVRDFAPDDFLSSRRQRWTDRFSQFAIAATRMAFDDAKFSPEAMSDETGVYVGSALGGLAYAEDQHTIFRDKGLRHVRPLLAISVFGGASSSNVSLEFGLRGPSVANGDSCAAGVVGIGDAFRAVARGEIRAAIAGGVEAPLSPLIFGAFALIKSMSKRNDDGPHASRPFDRDRDGFVMAEGAGIFLLERYDDAVARGAHVYGEICGYGLTNDAYHMTAPRPDGTSASRAMLGALYEARIEPGDVELIDAHGSSSQLNDSTETLAIKRAFGPRAYDIPIMATKGQHGHALGATGAWELAATLLAMRDGRLPRVVNLDNAGPDCDLDYVREERATSARIALSNSSGFGGINAALVVRSLA